MAYTFEDMYVEYVADAIEDERIELGAYGKPIKKVEYRGKEIIQTGDEFFDRMEREWVDDGEDLLDGIKEKAGKDG